MEKTYLTMEVLAEELARHEWPATYELENDLPDGIRVHFPACTVVFEEGYESEMIAKLGLEQSGLDRDVDIVELFHAMGGVSVPDGYRREHMIGGSEAKVRLGIQNLCRQILTHLRPALLGDKGWVERLRKK